MKTVLILGNSSAGLYDFRNETVEGLLKEYRVVVSLPDEVCREKLEAEGCIFEKTPLERRGTNPVRDRKLYAAYRGLIRKYRPAAVLTYTIKPNIYGGLACRKEKVPYCPTVTGLGSVFERGGALQKLVEMLYRVSLKDAACIFFQNGENRAVLEKAGIRGKKAETLPGSGVNLERHYPEPYPEDPVTRFLFVGRFMKEKGIEEYLAAADALADEKTKFYLIGYCDEAYEEKLRIKEEEGKIGRIGFFTEVHPFYKEAGAVVMPTYHEGMSNVLMEASATGRPVIASDIPGCREIVEDEKTGFLVLPRDADGRIKALSRFLALPAEERARMGKNGRKKMEESFDRRRVAAVYIKEVRRMTGQGEERL